MQISYLYYKFLVASQKNNQKEMEVLTAHKRRLVQYRLLNTLPSSNIVLDMTFFDSFNFLILRNFIDKCFFLRLLTVFGYKGEEK